MNLFMHANLRLPKLIKVSSGAKIMRISMENKTAVTALLLGSGIAASLQSNSAHAFDLQISGFGSVVATDLLQGESGAVAGRYTSPLYVGDWYNGGIYTKKNSVDLTQETRGGLQANLSLFSNFSAVAQVVGRTVDKAVTLEWAYLSYKPINKITLQAGRKRLPLFYYSDYQDVGYAYTWIRTPQELYGWEITNYDGASARYQDTIAGISVSSSVFGGNSEKKKSGYFTVLQEPSVDVRWTNIVGADVELNYEWLTTRISYVQSDAQYKNEGSEWADGNYSVDEKMKQRYYGIANNIEYESLLVLSEFNIAEKRNHPKNPENPTLDYTATAWSLGAGYRWGDFTPFVNASKYSETTTTPEVYAYPWNYSAYSFTLRWDFAPKQDVKFHYVKLNDDSKNETKPMGNSQSVSVSYDFSF